MFGGIPYGTYLDDPAGCRVSIDSLRMKFSVEKAYVFDKGKQLTAWAYTTLEHIARCLANYDLPYELSQSTYKIGSYNYVATFYRDTDLGDREWSFSVLFGRFVYDRERTVLSEIVLDLNPNKVPIPITQYVINLLINNSTSHELVRVDVAYDWNVPRSDLMMTNPKDRDYSKFSTKEGITEYLGKRSTHGGIKIYDKQAESQLEMSCTRVEVTVAGSKLHLLSRIYPDVAVLANSDGLTNASELSFVARACLLHPELTDLLSVCYERKAKNRYLHEIRSQQSAFLRPADPITIDLYVEQAINHYLGGVAPCVGGSMEYAALRYCSSDASLRWQPLPR